MINNIFLPLLYSIIISYRFIWLISILIFILSIWESSFLKFNLVTTFGLFSGILLHEIAHVIIARLYYPLSKIKLFTQNTHLNIIYPFNPIPSIIISVSGPFANIILAIIFCILTNNIFHILVIINILLGVGNLIPPSNDGKEIIKSLYLLFKNPNPPTSSSPS